MFLNSNPKFDPNNTLSYRLVVLFIPPNYPCTPGVGSSRLTQNDPNGHKTEAQIKAEILSISQGAHQQWHSHPSSQGMSGLGQGVGSSSVSANILSQPSQTSANSSASDGSQGGGLYTQDPTLHSQSVGATVTSSSSDQLYPNNQDNDDDHDILSQDDDEGDFSRQSWGHSYFPDFGGSQESQMSCVSALGATDPVLEEGESMITL